MLQHVLAWSYADHPAVDGTLADTLGVVIEATMIILVRFFAVVSFTPIFSIPGFFVFALGIYCGRVYIRAQLAVKREMSNARAPVLAHFGAAIAGLSESLHAHHVS